MIRQVQPWIGAAEREAVARCIDDNWLTEGPRCKEFAARLCELIGSPYGVFAPNGTLALALGLMALGIGRGDEVIVPNSTFIGSANAVVLTGAVPVSVDIEPDHFQIDVAQIEAAITPRTKAIMPVHLFGTAADMEFIEGLAEARNLFVIEDACQGIGVTTFDGPHVGSIGDVGCFSFFADKTITTGEGGFIVCRDMAVYERLLLLRNQGRPNSGTFIHPSIGWNFRITDMQAAIGLAQMDRLEVIIDRKQRIYAAYREELEGVSQIRILSAAPNSNLVPFRLVIMCDRAPELSEHLRANGVEPRGFFYPLHRQPCFSAGRAAQRDDKFPVSIRAHERGLCLPIYPTMAEADVSTVIRAIKVFYA